jgi:sulfur relay (sulfurtransferase) DsrF/TusC family protein
MTPHVLFIITSDPRTSGKPAEAIRIAAGIGAWKKTDVSVYLRDAAVLALGEDTTDLVNEDNYTRYLPMLGELQRPLYVQKNNSALSVLGASPVKFETLGDAELAKLATEHQYVLRF